MNWYAAVVFFLVGVLAGAGGLIVYCALAMANDYEQPAGVERRPL